MRNQKTVIFIVILVIVSAFSFLLGKNFENKNSVKDLSTLKNLVQVSTPKTDIKKEIPLLIDIEGPQKNLALSTNISQVLRGTLEKYNKNSWTIRYGKDTFTVSQQVPTQKIDFFLTNRKTNKTAPIKQNELRAGDYVNIITQYMPQEQQMAVVSITAYRQQ